jgi:hypothetical protein
MMPTDDLDRRLEALGRQIRSVEPSAGFVARVRLATAAAPRGGWVRWLSLASGAAALVALFLWTARPEPADPADRGTIALAEAAPRGGGPPDDARSVGAGVAPPQAAAPAPRLRRVGAGSQTPGSGSFDVLVPIEEQRALVRFLAAVRAGFEVGAVVGRPEVDELTGELVPVPPIVIPEIKIEYLPVPGAQSGGTRE